MNAINIQLRWNYWYLHCPFGIANIPRWRLIDIDEAALFVELANHSRGKSSIVRRVCDIGPYWHCEKLNILVLSSEKMLLLASLHIIGLTHGAMEVLLLSDLLHSLLIFYRILALELLKPSMCSQWMT